MYLYFGLNIYSMSFVCNCMYSIDCVWVKSLNWSGKYVRIPHTVRPGTICYILQQRSL